MKNAFAVRAEKARQRAGNPRNGERSSLKRSRLRGMRGLRHGWGVHFAWAAQQGYNLLTLGFPRPLPAFAESVRIYRDELSRLGRDWQIGTLYHTVVAEKSDDARRLATECFGRFLQGLRASAQRPTQFSQTGRATAGLADLDLPALIDQARLIAGNPQEVAAEVMPKLRASSRTPGHAWIATA